MIEQHHGYVIHQRPFKNNGYLLTLLNADGIKITALFHAAKKRLPQLFQRYFFTFQQGESLVFLRSLEVDRSHMLHQFTPQALVCGLYLNELLGRLANDQEPVPELFMAYQQALTSLSAKDKEDGMVSIYGQQRALRRFESILFHSQGMSLDFRHDSAGNGIEIQANYCLRIPEGFEKSSRGIPGATLLALADGKLQSPQQLRAAKHIHQAWINHLLQGKRLVSRELLRT